MQLWSAAQELPIADHQLGEMPKFRAQLYELTNTSLWVVNSALFFLLSELVSVLTCLSVMSPLHLLFRVSPQLNFSPLTSSAGGRKWVSTDSACLRRSTSCERIWLPVSFPLKFSKSHRLRTRLHIQATRKKIEHNSAIYKGHIATSLHIFQVVWGLEIAGWFSNCDVPPIRGLCLSGSPRKVTASSFQLQCHVWLLSI